MLLVKTVARHAFLAVSQVFLSVSDAPVEEGGQETLDEALSRVNGDIDSVPVLTDFPIGTLNIIVFKTTSVMMI